MKTTTWKVRSAGRRNGRIVTLNPSFLSALAAESYVRNLEAKYGDWYAYEVFSPDTVRTPEPEPEADWDTPRYQPTPEEIARHEREIREIERREWARFAGRDMSARATPEDGEVYDDGGCRRCARTGSFITAVVNGKPTGPGGACFKCQGKGYQTLADCKRNGYWERHQRVSL